MPTVPISSGRQVAPQAAQGGYQTPVGEGRAATQLAGAAGQLGGALAQLQEQRDQDLAFRADADMTQRFLEWDAKAREGAVEAKAAGYADQVKAWWTDEGAKLSDELTPRQKQLVSRSLQRRMTSSLDGAIAHEKQQLRVSQTKAYDAAQRMSAQAAVTAGTPDAVRGALADLAERRAAFAANAGWTPEQVKLDELERASAMHAAVVRKMAIDNPTRALAYYAEVKGQIDKDLQPQLEATLHTSDEAAAAFTQAASIWRAAGPKADGQAVQLDKLYQAAREAFPNDPKKAKATIAELDGLAQAHNAAEREREAQNINTAVAEYMRSGSLARMKLTAAFKALPSTRQNEVEQGLVTQRHAAWSRGQAYRNAAEDDADRKAMPEYLRLSDPAVLGAMSDAQVQALLPKLGPRLTQGLVERRRSLGTKEGALEVSLDQQLFNQLATEAGMQPYETNKSEDDKAKLGMLQYRLETLLAAEQARTGKKLGRLEKEQLLRREMGAMVQEKTWWGGVRDPVPAITLSPEQARRLYVPPEVRKQIDDAMKKHNVEPTEENVQQYYLRHRAPTASQFIPAPTDAK